jgi:cytochrome P450
VDRLRPVRDYPFGPPDGPLPHPLYAQLRDHEPLARVQMPYGDEAWLVTRYADARTVFGDPRFSRTAGGDDPRMSPEQTIEGLLSLDPPDHTRLRRLVATAFTARQVEQLRPRTQQIADDLVEAMVAAGPPADLVTGFALPLPLTVTCELLGVPVADRGRFERWASAIFDTSLSPRQFRDQVARLRAYMAGQVRRRRQDPSQADLLAALARAGDGQDRLSGDEILSLAMLLLAAGYETTAGQIANFVHVLGTHPGPADQLRDQPGLVPSAVEELMRFVANAAFAGPARYATEDVQLSGGVVRTPIRTGST